MNVSIVLGLGFGDEGKGSTVNWLCTQVNKPLIVRFSGGHQVGHTVVIGDTRHVFSNFGSGTLQGVPTYWSEFCTINPHGVQREGKALRESGYEPELYLNANAMVTTPFDILRNIKLDRERNHGSVGVGFGQTIQRNEDHYHLYVRDLKFPEIRDAKLKLLQEVYYGYSTAPKSRTKEVLDEFIVACDELVKNYEIVDNLDGFQDMHWIFEGSQGIMLDTDYGFFPHVTRSYCTSRNAMEIIKRYDEKANIRTYYVTRAYQTRHGNGPMTNEDKSSLLIKNNPLETNSSDGFQGVFRKTLLDLDMLHYALDCDTYHNPNSRKYMVITCLDHVPEDIPVTVNGEVERMKFDKIARHCRILFSLPSYSDEGTKERLL